jgi:hypothetical protein
VSQYSRTTTCTNSSTVSLAAAAEQLEALRVAITEYMQETNLEIVVLVEGWDAPTSDSVQVCNQRIYTYVYMCMYIYVYIHSPIYRIIYIRMLVLDSIQGRL